MSEVGAAVAGHFPQIQGIERDLVIQLTEMVRRALPDAVESFDDARVGFGIVGGYKGLVFTIEPLPGRVNLGVTDGATLDDPAGLLEGTGKRHRHVKLRSLEELRDPAFIELVMRAVARRSA